jgi:hypothetical protein
VNQRLQLVPGLLPAEAGVPWNPSEILKIRDAVWISDTLREEFIADNPARLSAADLALVESWRHRVVGQFYILRHLKQHSIFLREDPPKVYGVLGLVSPLRMQTVEPT